MDCLCSHYYVSCKLVYLSSVNFFCRSQRIVVKDKGGGDDNDKSEGDEQKSDKDGDNNEVKEKVNDNDNVDN